MKQKTSLSNILLQQQKKCFCLSFGKTVSLPPVFTRLQHQFRGWEEEEERERGRGEGEANKASTTTEIIDGFMTGVREP